VPRSWVQSCTVSESMAIVTYRYVFRWGGCRLGAPFWPSAPAVSPQAGAGSGEPRRPPDHSALGPDVNATQWPRIAFERSHPGQVLGLLRPIAEPVRRPDFAHAQLDVNLTCPSTHFRPQPGRYAGTQIAQNRLNGRTQQTMSCAMVPAQGRSSAETLTHSGRRSTEGFSTDKNHPNG
jgi:hypothetical protein